MSFMEIALLKNDSLRIKGKNAVLIVDSQEKADCNASLTLTREANRKEISDSTVIISGPGEYETGGVKITATQNESGLIYNISVDSVSLLLGEITTLEKLQQKLKEANILIVNCNNEMDASFVTGLVTNVIIFYGEKKTEIANEFGRENVKHLPKYVNTADKLPAEVETIILE